MTLDSALHETTFGSPQLTVVGVNPTFHLPNGGVVVLDAGKIVFEGQELGGPIVFQSAAHMWFDGNTSAFCAAFTSG
jgi:hypothetical protein